MKTDARIKRTRRALRDALIVCMSRRSIMDISVTEVCETANVNRTTFYKHYRDCFDLLQQIENDLIEQFRKAMELGASDMTKLVSALLDMIEKNCDLCSLIFRRHADDALIRKMIMIAHDYTVEEWRRRLKNITETEMELLFTCLANGLLHVVAEQYDKLSREEILGFVEKTVSACMKPYMWRTASRWNEFCAE